MANFEQSSSIEAPEWCKSCPLVDEVGRCIFGYEDDEENCKGFIRGTFNNLSDELANEVSSANPDEDRIDSYNKSLEELSNTARMIGFSITKEDK